MFNVKKFLAVALSTLCIATAPASIGDSSADCVNMSSMSCSVGSFSDNFFGVIEVSASNDTSAAAALTKLQEAVYEGKHNGGVNTYTTNTYITEGGGTLSYKDLVDGNGLLRSNFTQLTEKEKEKVLSHMIECADYAVETTGSNYGIVTEETKTIWMQNLQGCEGVGTQLMTTLLQNTKPDYATANRIYEPFSGYVGTFLGVAAIILMAFLAITIVLDLCYIGVPMFRIFLDGEDKGKGNKPKIISHEAISAVKECEEGSSNDGSFKYAAGVYFKHKTFVLILMGICLLYLVSGNIWSLVSMLLDLVSGFVGF